MRPALRPTPDRSALARSSRCPSAPDPAPSRPAGLPALLVPGAVPAHATDPDPARLLNAAAPARAAGAATPPLPDWARIGQAGLVAGLAQGGPLGLSFALSGLARARGRPHTKVLASFAPVVAAFLTAPGEQALRARLGAQATLPLHATLAHDAIPGAILFLANLAWQRLPAPRRPPAFTPAGLAATVLVSMAGSLVGGMLAEASAQRSHGGPAGSAPGEGPRVVPALNKGMGRALSLLPLVIWLQAPACLATAGRPLPRWTGLAGTGVACVGWTFRRLLTHPGQAPSPAAIDGAERATRTEGP